MKKKIAFIIGHNEKSKGFFSTHLKKTEFDFYSDMVQDLEQIGTVFFHDPTISSYTNRCKDIAKRIGSGFDLIVSLHFNAFNGTANGVECFYWHTNGQGFEAAKTFVDNYSKLTGTRPRGAKAYQKNKNGKLPRGAGEVFYTKGTAVLLEPFFGDNKSDCEKFKIDSFLYSIKRMINGL